MLDYNNSTSIYYYDNNKFEAQYIKIILESFGIKPYMNSGYRSKIAFFYRKPQNHFLIVPEFDDILHPAYAKFELTLKSIIENTPDSCIVLIVSSETMSSYRFQDTIDSTKRRFRGRVEVIIQPLHDSTFNLTRKVANVIMSTKPTDKVLSIATPFEKLVFVTKDSLFSDLYFKMSTLGVRHCPVIDPKSRKCFRIISRRDLLKLIPPGNILIPQQVQDETGITISQLTLVELIEELSDQKIGDLFSDQDLIFVDPTDEIKKAVELLSIRHALGDKKIYISGLPIIDKERLVGFISYVDILKRFIKEQKQYLNKVTVRSVATLAEQNKPLFTLTESQCLQDAYMRIERFGVRSLPVVDKPKGNKLVGFVEDIQVMSYNHPAFVQELGQLPVKYFMTPIERLYTPMPGELLQNSLDKFWKADSGIYPPSTLVVCDTQQGNNKLIEGVLSYVDILRDWRRWYSEEQSNSSNNSEDVH